MESSLGYLVPSPPSVIAPVTRDRQSKKLGSIILCCGSPWYHDWLPSCLQYPVAGLNARAWRKISIDVKYMRGVLSSRFGISRGRAGCSSAPSAWVLWEYEGEKKQQAVKTSSSGFRPPNSKTTKKTTKKTTRSKKKQLVKLNI